MTVVPHIRTLLPDGSLPAESQAFVSQQVREQVPDLDELRALAASVPAVIQDATDSVIDTLSGSFAHVTTGKNLYNPSADTLDVYVVSHGEEVPFVGFRTSDYIPVVEGLPYSLSAVRHLTFYDADHTYLPSSWTAVNPQAQQVVTAPVGAHFLRVSYGPGMTPGAMQVEQSEAPTPYEPFRRILDPTVQLAPTGPLDVGMDGDSITVATDLGGALLQVGLKEQAGSNGVLNFTSAALGGASLGTVSDDVAPVWTQNYVVGANHGIAVASRWAAGTHGKTLADLGSVWTDGVDEWALLHIDATGNLYAGRAPTTGNDGETLVSGAAPVGDLTHVSGATSTATLPLSGRTASQLWPWVQRRRLTARLDGSPLADGVHRGHELVIRETYEVLDYGPVYDWATTHPGQSYTTAHHEAAIGVENEWRIRPGGKLRCKIALYEIRPTRITRFGGIQAATVPGAVTRWLPGVGVIGGLDWSAGVPLSSLTTSQTVTTSHLTGAHPPTVLVDARDDIALAVGVSPWAGASRSPERLASTPSLLWELRNTRKIYPVIVGDTPPGWGRIEVEGIRAWLTPDEAAAIVTNADPLSAWATLDQLA